MVRGAFSQRHILLSRLRVYLHRTARFLWKYTARAAVNLIVCAALCSFHTAILKTRTKNRLQPVLRRAGQAARGYERRLQAQVERYAVGFAVGLVAWTVGFAFFAILFSARMRVAGNETLHAAAAAARHSGRWLLDGLPGLWLGNLGRPRSSSALLVSFSRLLLLGLIFSLVFLQPTYAKAPNEVLTPTATPQPATPTPTATLTSTPTATLTPTPTATLEPTATPTLAITAISWRQGTGNCGPEDGLTGTGSYVWPTTDRRIWGNYAPGWGHYGIDIAGVLDNDIYAADSGVVVFAGWNTEGYGNLLVVDHGNGSQTLYAHLSSLLFQCGESVQQGETIAAMGSTGWSIGPHLHFEIVKAGIGNVDPLEYLEQ